MKRWRTVAWVIAVVGGLAVGGFAFHFPGSYGEAGVSVAAATFGLLIGGVNGVIVGALTGLAAGFPRTEVRRWTLAMGGIVAVTHAIFDGSSTVLPFAAYALMSGVAVGAVLAVGLEFGSLRQPAILGIAWTIGLVAANEIGGRLGLPWEQTPIGWATDHAVDGVIVGLVWVVATLAIGGPEAIRGVGARDPRAPSGPT